MQRVHNAWFSLRFARSLIRSCCKVKSIFEGDWVAGVVLKALPVSAGDTMFDSTYGRTDIVDDGNVGV